MNRRPGQVERAIEAIKWVIGVGDQSGPHRLVLDPQQKYSVPIASKYPSHEGLSYELICRLIYGVFHSKHPFSRDTPPLSIPRVPALRPPCPRSAIEFEMNLTD